MELRMIKTFQTVVRLGSFQQAAEVLRYSQPTITMHIQKLESDLGTKLLFRGKTIQLTEAGRVFHERADQLLKDYDSLSSTLSDLVQGEAGQVRFGISEPTASSRMPGILSDFLRRHPKIQPSLKIGDSKMLNRLVLDEELDFAVCPSPELHVDTEFEPLLYEPMGLLVYDSHPLANRKDIMLHELKDEKFLLTPPNCPFRIRIEQQLYESLNEAFHGIEVSSILAHKHYVQAGLGISIAPILTVTPLVPGTRLIRIADLDFGPVAGILRKRSVKLGSAAEKLLGEIRDALRSENADRQLDDGLAIRLA